MYTQLAHDCCDMSFDGGFGDGQIKSDLLVQFAFTDQVEDARLLICKRRQP